MSHRHFNIEERNCIAYGIKHEKSMREISRILSCSHSSILREIRRKKNCGAKLKLTEELSNEIIKRLEKHHSPEQIAGRLKKEKLVKKLSFKSVYNWIYKGLLPKISILNLRRKGKRSSCHDGRGKIGGKRSSILTMVERVSRFTYIYILEGKVSESVRSKIKLLRNSLAKKLLKTVTLDNGKEFSKHREIELDNLISIYFSNLGSPHERGTNENTNGLLREYFPKGRDLSKVSNTELSEVLLELNTIPRKCLNYNTPLEVLQLYL